MELTAQMVVPDSLPDTAEDVRRCAQCGGATFHVIVRRMVYTPGGVRTLRLWSCEVHPLPEEGLVAR